MIRLKKKSKKILLWLTSVRACKSKLMRKFFQKSNWMFAVSYLMKKIKNIFLEVISNTKIFYIIFFSQWSCQRPRFCQTYRGTRQRRDWTTSNTVYQILSVDFWVISSVTGSILKIASLSSFTFSQWHINLLFLLWDIMT